MKAKIILPFLGLTLALVLSACGDDKPADSLTAADVACQQVRTAGGTCAGAAAAAAGTVTVSSITTVTNTANSVVTVTTVGSTTGT